MFNFRTLLILGKEKFQTNNQECDFVEMYQKQICTNKTQIRLKQHSLKIIDFFHPHCKGFPDRLKITQIQSSLMYKAVQEKFPPYKSNNQK